MHRLNYGFCRGVNSVAGPHCTRIDAAIHRQGAADIPEGLCGVRTWTDAKNPWCGVRHPVLKRDSSGRRTITSEDNGLCERFGGPFPDVAESRCNVHSREYGRILIQLHGFPDIKTQQEIG
jgi:hypothetical protein